ncbi:MAG: LysM peptidoglycan-binding domain-containing protein [Betaproteobacteria bacterium]|nr:LysM peptidoglycan-binding domain-containing protein [Betaproteobacteria bacterium]
MGSGNVGQRAWRRAALGAVIALVVAGCATPPAAPPPAPAPVAPVAPAPEAAAPAPPPPAPELTPAQAKTQAQKLAIEAVDLLQNGDEAAARATLDKALALDATNELARKLLDQVRADAQKELGPVYFRYTVQRDDSLSKLAQQFLGDRFRFYILAKYNDMANPSRLAAGQVLRIPGKAPPPATSAKPPEPAEATARPPVAAEPEAKSSDEVLQAQRRARELEAKGNLEGAYAALSESLQRFPGNEALTRQRDGTRAALIRSYDREAAQAFQRQNLDLAIAKWDRILELDPANRKARLERERALELKKKMTEKFGGK